MDKLYLMYLRKSRADADYSDEQTLSRHRARLEELCSTLHISCQRVIEEVGSADSIAARPGMMELLSLVETGGYEGVVCIDMDRLSRGSGADQALVINTFKFSDTKIITPLKTYDFALETDEQFAELGLFIAKQEYRQIKKRLYQGRIDSTKEGKYQGSLPPFGYDKYKLKGRKGFSLKINEQEAEVVRLIYRMYLNREGGCNKIARLLSSRGIHTRTGKDWDQNRIRRILTDPTYIGKTVLGHIHTVVEMRDGVLEKRNLVNKNPLVADGMHDPIISEEDFLRAKELLSKNNIGKINKEKAPVNPLSGIIRCPVCGGLFRVATSSIRHGKPILTCKTTGCSNRGTYLSLAESAILNGLNEWLQNYDVTTKEQNTVSSGLKTVLLEKKRTAETKLARCFDAYEQGVYDLGEFKDRSQKLKAEIKSLDEELKTVEEKLNKKDELAPKIRTVLDMYVGCDDIMEKNKMLSEVLEKVELRRESYGIKTMDDFEITLYPKIPR